MPDPALIETAKRWLRAGFSVIPVKSDKRAYEEWKPYQIRPYQIDDVERVFSDPRAKHVAIVCGYGGVFCFDFDPDKNGIAKEPFDLEQDFYIPWQDLAESLDIKLATQKTRSGGTHVLMLTPEPVGNIKLASVEATPDVKGKVRTHTAIETRGSGGYFLLYDLELDPNSLPSITNEQFQTLLEAAMDLDRAPEPATGYQNAITQRQHSGKKAHATREGFVGWFNEHYTPQEILERNRYRRVRDKYLCPDSTSGNAGVYLFQDSSGMWMCYSHHGDALGDGHAHDAFDAFKVLEWNGDFAPALGEAQRLKNEREGENRFTFTQQKKSEEATAALKFDKAIGVAMRLSLGTNDEPFSWSFSLPEKERKEFLRRYPNAEHIDGEVRVSGELALRLGDYYARLLGEDMKRPFEAFLDRARVRGREGNPELRSNATKPVPDATSFNLSTLRSKDKKSDLTSIDLTGVRTKDLTSQTEEMAFDLSSQTKANVPKAENAEVKTESPAQLMIDALNPIQKWGDRDEPPPVQWLVHNLIQDNAENLIAGEPGVGKSWISGDLAVSVATGGQFLERYTRQGPVLLVNFDDPSESLPRMFAHRSATGRHYEFRELPIYYWQPDEKAAYPPEGIITPDVFEYLLNQCDLLKPRLIIVDAFSSAFPGIDGNKGPDTIRAFEALRQLRIAAGKPCSLVLLDHTPKATMMDSKRRGVSGSQQKHAKTRTVHIIRKVEPGEVNGDDVLEWEVFKANAAPYQDAFGVDREMDGLLEAAKLTVRDLPPSGKNAVANRAAKAALTYLRGRPGENVSRADLMKEVITISNASKASVDRALNSTEFIDHPGIQRVDLGGRGNPIGFMWVAPTESTESFYSKLKTRVLAKGWGNEPSRKRLEAYFERADAGDETAKDALDEYLNRSDVREALAKESG